VINFINGEVVKVAENAFVLLNNGIGWEINASNGTLADFSTIGDTVTVYTYMHVKEDGISLYGFSSLEEKEMFLRLLSVNGVGPKMALQILSGMRASDLSLAILTGDTVKLTRIKGLGKKTAERIVLELKEKISPMEMFIQSVSYSEIPQEKPKSLTTGAASEALTVLMSLGMTKNEAQKHIKNAMNDGCVSSKEIIQYAVKHNI